LLGNNDRGWCVDFDFIIANDINYIKVCEGKYKSKKNYQNKSNTQMNTTTDPIGTIAESQRILQGMLDADKQN
jgi:hypothetical protein